MTVEIKLTKGYVAVVDDCDADLAELKWMAHVTKCGLVYAVRSIHVKERTVSVKMHRVILSRVVGRDLKTSELVDHENGDGLRNVRSNLRIATCGQNNANSRKRIDNSSSYKGVHQNGTGWVAMIRFNRKKMYLGTFSTAKEAGIAYNHAAKKYFGEFAHPNDIEGWETAIVEPRNRPITERDFKYVYRNTSNDKWRAMPYANGKAHFIGIFDTPEEARQAILNWKANT